MTIDQAVKILNARKHGGTEWRVSSPAVATSKEGRIFTAFEAIAIADWYERNVEDPEGPVQT